MSRPIQCVTVLTVVTQKNRAHGSTVVICVSLKCLTAVEVGLTWLFSSSWSLLPLLRLVL